uniref:Uncharacterized protein n=1 Tax=Graphocephala atropunctata TaxID=36148 RepID=A0A1B6LW37_9HEMI
MAKALLAVTVTIVVAVAATLAQETYKATWDDIDLDKVLANDRLLKAYVDCLLDRGACPPEGAALKRILPEALKTDCAKCTLKQLQGAIKVVKFMVEKKPDLWGEILSKYDPDGILSKKFQQ